MRITTLLGPLISTLLLNGADASTSEHRLYFRFIPGYSYVIDADDNLDLDEALDNVQLLIGGEAVVL